MPDDSATGLPITFKRDVSLLFIPSQVNAHRFKIVTEILLTGMLTFTTLLANSADNTLMIFFSFFTENKI